MAEDQGLCEEMTCSICLEYFKDPVTIDCGHNFCQACITEYCGKAGPEVSCPQCRETVQQKNFRLNRQLAGIIEIAKKFRLHRIKGAETLGQLCERHLEPLKLFCQDDQTPICVVCDKAKEHRGHKVIPKEEAFEEYKVKGQAYLEFLKKERKAIWTSQQNGGVEGQTLLEQTERERQNIRAEFKQLHQFLEKQERHLLTKLKDLDDQIKDKRNAHISKLSEEISAVDLRIKEMEEKLKQPASEFLQDIGNIFQWCNKEEFVNPVAFPLELKQQIENFSKMHSFLDTTMNKLKDYSSCPQSSVSFFLSCWDHFGAYVPFPVMTANFTDSRTYTVPTLVLSADCLPKVVSFGASQQHSYFGWSHSQSSNFYQNPEQFSCSSYVMGVERINSGSCSWVMNIKNETFWAVGVALECFRGRNMSSLTPEQGIWAVGKSSGEWYSFTSSGTCPLVCPWSNNLMPACPISPCNGTTIRVSLNHKQDSVTFFDADNNSPIYTFRNASFSGQPISSWFLVCK